MRSYRVVHQVPRRQATQRWLRAVADSRQAPLHIRMVSDDDGDAVKLLALLGPSRDHMRHLSHARRAGDEST
jgi:hypothetical protein